MSLLLLVFFSIFISQRGEIKACDRVDFVLLHLEGKACHLQSWARDCKDQVDNLQQNGHTELEYWEAIYNVFPMFLDKVKRQRMSRRGM